MAFAAHPGPILAYDSSMGSRAFVDIYRGKSPNELPAYSPTEAAALLALPVATLRSWLFGYDYSRHGQSRRFQSVIRIADAHDRLLSFQNLLELNILAALRRRHAVQLQAVRKAIAFLERTSASKHPLADLDLLTDGTSILVEQYGRLINASADGQMAIKETVERYLTRVERDRHGLALRFYPMREPRTEVRLISVDPRVQFGRPCLSGTGIPTAVVAERFVAGESMDSLVADYRIPQEQIEEAVRYESRLLDAA